MDVIKVSPGELEGFSGKIQSSSGELDAILQELRSKVEAIQWSGGDEAAYKTQRLEWESAATDLNMLLGRIGRAVGMAKQDYVGTESVNARMFPV